MDLLGSIGKLYTFILLALLFLGSGLAVWAGVNSIIKNSEKIKEKTETIKSKYNVKIQNIMNKTNGGISMNNGFIKLAVFSFIGIIISAAVLTMLPKSSGATGNMNLQGNMYGQSGMNMQGMNGQSYTNMQGMSNNGMQSYAYNSGDVNSIQQQLYNIQQQINQLQYQMNYNSMYGMNSYSGYGMGSSNMNNNNMNSSMNSNMNNMNNNNMNNMSNSNMNSNNMNSNMNNSGSMPMM